MSNETSEVEGAVVPSQETAAAPQKKPRRVPPPFVLMTGTAHDPQQPWYFCQHCSYVVAGPDKSFGHNAACGWFVLQKRLSGFQVTNFAVAWSHADDVLRNLVLRFPASALRLGDFARGPQINVRFDRMTLLQALDRIAEMSGMRWTVDRELRVGLEYLPAASAA